MAQSSLQLDIENALVGYIQAQNTANNLFETDRSINAGHAISTPSDTGNYIAVMADPPDWGELVYAGESIVTFRIATQVSDPSARSTKSTDHKKAVGAIIQLFCDQNFPASRTAINAAQSGAFQINFIGWDNLRPEPDGYSESQMITILPYAMQIFIKQDV